MEDLAGLHEILDVLAQHGVLRLQPEVFFFDFINSVGLKYDSLSLFGYRFKPEILFSFS